MGWAPVVHGPASTHQYAPGVPKFHQNLDSISGSFPRIDSPGEDGIDHKGALDLERIRSDGRLLLTPKSWNELDRLLQEYGK